MERKTTISCFISSFLSHINLFIAPKCIRSIKIILCLLFFILSSPCLTATEVNEAIFGTILSNEECRDLLSPMRLSFFRPLPLNYATYESWKDLATLQKLPYLVDRSNLINIFREFSDIFNNYYEKFLSVGEKCVDEDENKSIDVDKVIFSGNYDIGDKCLTQTMLQISWIDFTPTDQIERVFHSCNIDSKDDGIDWWEYLLCRGRFSKYGVEYDVSEYIYAENVVLHDFSLSLRDPNNPAVLALILMDKL